MSVRYRDLITYTHIHEDALDSSKLLEGVSNIAAIERVIGWASERIERYLDRRLIARRYEKFRPAWEVFDKRDPDLDDNYYVAEAREWPVLHVETSDPVITIHEQEDRILSDEEPEIVDLVAGYKRSDQTQSDVETETGVTLSSTPPDLPMDVRQVCSNIVRHRLQVTEAQLDGIQEKTAQVRQDTLSIRSPDRNYVMDQLRMLSTYRHFSP